MKAKLRLAITAFSISTVLQVCAQGYIVPNGVIYVDFSPSPISGIVLSQNSTASDYTGFILIPQGANSFSFAVIADEGVRVFLVSANDPISLQPILSQHYAELGYPPADYFFADGFPFYVGLYTSQHPAVNGIYDDPLFGWAQLVNNNGVIELLDSALEYGGGGIIAGTQTIISPFPNRAQLDSSRWAVCSSFGNAAGVEELNLAAKHPA
jgi:hypothetical protein